jgi:hypothetical protein
MAARGRNLVHPLRETPVLILHFLQVITQKTNQPTMKTKKTNPLLLATVGQAGVILSQAVDWYGSRERLAAMLALPSERLWEEYDEVGGPTFPEYAAAKSGARDLLREELIRRGEIDPYFTTL